MSALAIATLIVCMLQAGSAKGAPLALVLAVDVSASVTADSYLLQRDGIARAFSNLRLVEAISAAPGGIEVLVLEWSDPDKIVVTGIPNFDNCRRFLANTFPERDFVLVCTSDVRETFGFEDRKAFIMNAVRIANGRPLIFKLHPNERVGRATREIARYAPQARVYATGSAEEMIANCTVLITRFSSTAYVGLALGKEVYSDFDVDDLRQKTPIQTGTAAEAIAGVCRKLLTAPEHAVDMSPLPARRDELTPELAG